MYISSIIIFLNRVNVRFVFQVGNAVRIFYNRLTGVYKGKLEIIIFIKT